MKKLNIIGDRVAIPHEEYITSDNCFFSRMIHVRNTIQTMSSTTWTKVPAHHHAGKRVYSNANWIIRHSDYTQADVSQSRTERGSDDSQLVWENGIRCCIPTLELKEILWVSSSNYHIYLYIYMFCYAWHTNFLGT